MDMLEHTLDPSHDKGVDDGGGDVDTVHLTEHSDTDGVEEQAAAIASVAGHNMVTIDPTMQYQLRADTAQGQVTYRVVQVTQNEDGQAHVVAANAFQQASQDDVTYQAVLPNSYSNGGSPTPEILTNNDTKFAYLPASVADNVVNQAPESQSSLGQVATAGGQFYVMMSPQEVLQSGQRAIAPRTGMSPAVTNSRGTRDERRRASHNEVERRRRDKINNWIVTLSKLVPDCPPESTKPGQSKGGILSKACDYITELRTANIRMAESLKENERMIVDSELLRQQCEELKHENDLLRAQLQQHGLVPPDLSVPNS